MSSYANIPNIKEQTGWRVSFWFAVTSPLVDVSLGFLAAAQESWRRARTKLEPFLKEQPENYNLIGNLALTDMGLRDKASALALAERAMAVIPVGKDALSGPTPIDVFARAAAQVGEPDRAIAALRRLLSIPYGSHLAANVPLTTALLRLDPMFDPLRNDPRFQKLVASPEPKR